MRLLKNKMIFSEDIKMIFNGINAFDFKYSYVPSDSVFDSVRKDFKKDTCRIFNNDVAIIKEEEMLEVNSLLSNKTPIVTLDKIYITPDEKNIFFLDCTRVSGTNEIVARKGESLEDQIKRIALSLPIKEIIIADDVVFSGQVLTTIIEKFKNYGIKVIGIVAGISAYDSYNKFNKKLKDGIKVNYLMEEDVIDQICERDFYFGVAGSGIMMSKERKDKAPYFIPFGDPQRRASIPEESVVDFSKGCIRRSIDIWDYIDKQRGRETQMKDLPEKIIKTNDNDYVVRVLKKELKRL